MLRGYTPEIVVAVVAMQSRRDAPGVRYSPVRCLVPEMGAFIDRFEYCGHVHAFLKDDHPVVMVNWYEAAAFAHAVGCALPTEFQWLWAALGGQPQATTEFPISLEHAIWNLDRTRHHTASVVHDVENRRNGYELIDPIGNVLEWQGNRHADAYHELMAKPYGPFATENFSVRGGSWLSHHRGDLALPERSVGHAGSQSNFLGFRLWRPKTPDA